MVSTRIYTKKGTVDLHPRKRTILVMTGGRPKLTVKEAQQLVGDLAYQIGELEARLALANKEDD